MNDRAQRDELEAAERWCEVRIGELLGKAKAGPQPESSPAREVSDKDRWKFRLLAEHKGLVERLLIGEETGKPVTSRRRILARIERERNGSQAADVSGIAFASRRFP